MFVNKTAIDAQDGSGDVVCRVGSEERYCAADIIRSPEATEWQLSRLFLDVFLREQVALMVQMAVFISPTGPISENVTTAMACIAPAAAFTKFRMAM